MKHFYLFLLGMTFLLGACRSPLKLADSGAYDPAIDLAIKKLRGKKNKNPNHVLALERAFAKANDRDLRNIENLKKEGQPNNWDAVTELYRLVKSRQTKVTPLLPLYDKNGRQANFKMVAVDDAERESRQKAADYNYSFAVLQLNKGEKGDRFAAREALGYLEKIDQYYANYKDKEELKQKARNLGVTHVAFQMVNNANMILPADFEKALLNMNVSDLDRGWVHYDLKPDLANNRYHYKLAMSLQRIDVSPEQVKEREYEDSKEINDGYQYVYDANGNVKKDSLGNDIKVPKVVKVSAKVLETSQRKVAGLSGRLIYYDQFNKEMKSVPIAVDAVFENYAATFKGDKRALSPESTKKLGNRPLPFPTTEALLLQAADQLKPIVIREMTSNQGIIQ